MVWHNVITRDSLQVRKKFRNKTIFFFANSSKNVIFYCKLQQGASVLYAITSNAAGDGLMSKTLDMAGRAEAVALMQNMADGFSKINVPDPNKLVPFIESVTGSVMSIMEVNIPIFLLLRS